VLRGLISALLHTDDPDIKRKLMDGVPLADIPLPVGSTPTEEELQRWTEGDDELAQFLRCTECQLEGRLASVEEQIAEYEKEAPSPVPACPKCGQGTLAFHDYGE
jgi:hypothetical protein